MLRARQDRDADEDREGPAAALQAVLSDDTEPQRRCATPQPPRFCRSSRTLDLAVFF